MRSVSRTLLAIGAIGILGGIAHAATITAGGDLLNQSSVPPPGSQGYVFYGATVGSGANYTGANANLNTVPSQYSISTSGSQQANDNTYAPITVNGKSYTTGVLYTTTSGSTAATLATITLDGTTGAVTGTPVPSFTLGVLADNAGNSTANNMASVTVTGANSVKTFVAGNGTPGGALNNHDDFYFFNVTNAVVGDTITVAATTTPTGSNNNIGGLTFDTSSPVPEPATLGMLALGGIGVLAKKRRRTA